MIINLNNIKKKNVLWLNPYKFLQPHSVDGIGQVHEAKLLNVILSQKFHMDSHAQFLLRQCILLNLL